jgi:hypothetical protein
MSIPARNKQRLMLINPVLYASGAALLLLKLPRACTTVPSCRKCWHRDLMQRTP